MLKKLEIRNFQCHSYLKIRFHPYVTIFVGKNDAGKSAILRSLRWLFSNRPAGKGFITHGKKSTSVSLFLGGDNGARIDRKTGNSNLYTLNGKKFKAFGLSIPPEISKLLNISEINYQGQHSPAFWFALPPGQVAKELNKIVDLETIDRIQAAITKRVRDKKAELKVAQERLSDLKDEISELAWVKPLDRQLNQLNHQYGGIVAKSSVVDSLALLTNQAVGADTSYRNARAGQQQANTAFVAGGAAIQAGKRETELKRLYWAVRAAERAIRPIPKLPAMPETNQMANLKSLLVEILDQQEVVDDHEKELEELKVVKEDNLGGRCPMCGSFLTDQTLI